MLSDFDFKNNSIGFLRFLFATAVIWSHAYPLGGFGEDPISAFSLGKENAGNLAVAGFFLLSGFLITRSYTTSGNFGRFLWHRFLRIFPAFWVCLIVVALVFAPLAFLHERGSLSGFLTAPNSPWRYITINVSLWMFQYNVAGTLSHVPYPRSFNGSLWTLRFEFLCYLTVGFLGLGGILKRGSASVLALAGVLFMAYAIPIALRGIIPPPFAFNALFQGNNRLVPELLIYFFFGSAAYMFRSGIPMNGWIAVLSGTAVFASIPFQVYALVVPPALSYLVLFVAMKLPPRNFDRQVDLSYGIYIYAFPTQQLLSSFGYNKLGFGPYMLGGCVITAAFALFSWFAIEKPCLSLKHLGLRPRVMQL